MMRNEKPCEREAEAPGGVSTDESIRRNPLERCPRPPYLQDRSDENQKVQETHQDEDLIIIKVKEEDPEEEVMWGHQTCKREMETPVEVTTDKSTKGNPPERCPRPPYSQDRPEENRNVTENYQDEDLIIIKVKEEDPEEEMMWGHQTCKGEVETPVEVTTDESTKGNPPERCPHPPYSQDRPEKNRNVAENYEDEGLIIIKVEDPEEERMWGDQTCKTEVEEKTPVDVSAENHSAGNVLRCQNSKTENEDILQYSSGKNFVKIKVNPGLRGTKLSRKTPNREKPSADPSQIVTQSKGQKAGKKIQGGKRFPKSSGLVKRRRIPTGKKPFSCSTCGKCFTNQSHFVTHERIHTGEKPFSCSLCGKRFSDHSSLVRHEKIHTGEKLFSCSECDKCFIDNSSLVRHQRSHTGEKPYSCPLCGKSFARKSYLVTHERSHTGEKPYSCPVCGKCFAQKSHLLTHEKSHTAEKAYSRSAASRLTPEGTRVREKLYSCSECGKCFLSKAALRDHHRIHTGEKPFSCSDCGKCFTNRPHLVKHQRTHTQEKPYSCPECGRCFTEKSSLVRHERNHTGEKPYSCSECRKCFTRKSYLLKHQSIHTGEKPFSCSECGKCFTYESYLVKHERIHTGEKPFSCQECAKSFTHKYDLVRHQQIHSGEQPFSCSDCGRSFTHKSYLVKHQRIHTGETASENFYGKETVVMFEVWENLEEGNNCYPSGSS